MIIPIGHEEDSVRRLPWVTFGVMIACCLAFVLSGGLGPLGDGELADDFEPAVEYYFEHPYLEVDPEFQDMVFGGGSGGHREELLEAFRAQLPRPEDPDELRREQQRLDELIQKAMGGLHSHPFLRYGLIPNKPTVVTLFSHMFMHAGLLHLLGNLLILYLGGPFIEDVWGRPLYGAFYLLAGVAAAALFIAFNPDSPVPMIGASGAIAGVMGAFLVRYWNTKIRFLYIFGIVFRGTFSAAAWVMLPIWFGQQLFMALVLSGAQIGGGVAYWAHVGGFAVGVAAALAVRHWKIEERLAPSIESKIAATVVDNAAVERALEANATGNGDRAMEILTLEAGRDPGNHDVALALWGVAAEQRREPEAAQAMLNVIRSEIRHGDTGLALAHWAELARGVPDLKVDSDMLIRVSQLLGREGRRDEAASALRRALLTAGSEMPSATALRIARAARSLDPLVAAGALRLALSRADIEPLARHQAEQLLAQLSEPQPPTPQTPR